MLKGIFFICSLVATGYALSGPSYSKDTTNIDTRFDGRIVGGREVSIVRYPHQCTMRYKRCDQCAFSHLCGASVYTENILVTAAHCLRGRYEKNFLIVCGTDNRSGSDGAVVLVKRFIQHENYSPISKDNDVGIMLVSPPLPLNNLTIAAIPLAEHTPQNGVISQVTGWGATDEGGYSSNKLKVVDVPIVSNELCEEAYGEGKITVDMICAGTAIGGKDACQGDSGGPLVVNDTLAGVVSWGRGCARPGFPGIYANVAYLKKWIEDAAININMPNIEN